MAPHCRRRSGVVERISERICPHVFRIVALSAPTKREKLQMCIQRYIPHLPPESSASRHIICTDKELDLDAGPSQFVQIYMPARNFATRTREEYRSDLEDPAAFLRDRRIAPGR